MHIRIDGRRGTACFDAEPNQTLLEAALSAGAEVPYSCASGGCGLCKARLAAGEVTSLWPEAPGYGSKPRPADVLLCQCAARAEGEGGAVVLSLAGAPPGPSDAAPAARPSRIGATLVARAPIGEAMLDVEFELDRPITYAAGQFGLFYFPGIAGGRAFSFAAPSTAPGRRVRLMVKRKPDGPATALLFGPDAIGIRAEMFGPIGLATFAPDRDGDVLCVVGGSGLSVGLAVMGAAVAAGHFPAHRGTLIVALRRAEELADLGPLLAMAQSAGGRPRVVIALSDSTTAPPGWAPAPVRVEAGYAHEVMRRVMEGDYAGHVAFVAGPPAMVQAVQRVLILEGRLRGPDIRCDSFF